MNIFRKVTLASLRKNKIRTLVTIIGIILSVSMICGVSTLTSSLQNYMLQLAIYVDGDWHGSEKNTKYETYNMLSHSDKIESASYVQQLGYAIAGKSQNDYKPYLYLLGADKEIQNTLPIHIIEGKYPTNQKEILLPEHLSGNGGIKYEIGDALTLELGERTMDGAVLTQENPFVAYEEENVVISKEKIEVRETRTYTVVGFYKRPNFENYTAPGYTAITIGDGGSSDYLYDVYYKMKEPAQIYSFIEEHGLSGQVNDDVLRGLRVNDGSAWGIVISSLELIVIGLIMFGSITVIYNAFSISVSERTKQFGMLASVGATMKQLRGMVLFEAFCVGVVGIPLGILAGVVGIGVTLMAVEEKFKSFGYPIAMELCVSLEAILVTVVFSVLTILISAWIPAIRATKITAIEAIRQNKDIYTNGKKIKTSKLMYQLFGFQGMIAGRYFKRSKRKYRTTIVSLFMSIVLFISASAFTDYLLESIMSWYTAANYDLEMLYYQEENISKNELLEWIKKEAYVTDVAYKQGFYLESEIDKSYFNEEFAENINEYTYDITESGEQKVKMYVNVDFVNDEAFKGLLRQYELDEETYMDPKQPLAVVVDGRINYNYVKNESVKTDLLNSDDTEFTVFVRKEIEGYVCEGSTIDEDGNEVVRYVNELEPDKVLELSYEESYDKQKLKAGKRIYECPYFVSSNEMLNFIYPESVKSEVLPKTMKETEAELVDYLSGTDETAYDYFIKSENHVASYAAIKDLLDENGIRADMYNRAEEIESERNYIAIMKVFSYGFSILISLIAAANVFNTISTNIGLRRREFAMLKSVGMSEKGFQKMMNYECLLYGARALLYGLPVACVITYFIFCAIAEGFVTTFRLPWGAIFIAIISVFGVVFATMMYSMSKIKKENVIDALKNENA